MSYIPGLVVWCSGLSGAGKSTLCSLVAEILERRSMQSFILDADDLRKNINSDLGYSLNDRKENIRRIAHIANMVSSTSSVVLVAAITPTNEIRAMVRGIIPKVIEVYVNASLQVCESRDVKGLYERARKGLIQGLTGIDSPFEPPDKLDVICDTEHETETESAGRIFTAISERIIHEH